MIYIVRQDENENEIKIERSSMNKRTEVYDSTTCRSSKQSLLRFTLSMKDHLDVFSTLKAAYLGYSKLFYF